MARRSQRDLNRIASSAVARDFIEDLTWPVDLRVFEDLRTYHPAGPFRAAQGYSSFDGQVVDRSRVTRSRTVAPNFSGHIGFNVPSRVFVCARRKVRREVLMARSKGRGVRSLKMRRRNYYSDVRC